jgi:hypothetical protein
VLWAHNSHLGDARATEMGQRGELNVGQLVRERHGREARAGRLQHLYWDRDRGLGLGRAKEGLPGASKQLRSTVP